MTDVQVHLSAIIRWHYRDGNELHGQQAVIVPDEWPDGEVVTVVRGVVPEGLYPGPVVDGVQTYYGEFDSVPAGWEYRRSVGHGYWWIDGKRPADRCLDGDLVVQCRQRQPRTERVPWHESVGRIAITPADKEHARIVRVERKDGSGTLPWVWTDPEGPGNGCGIGFPSFDGMVEVLIEDDDQ